MDFADKIKELSGRVKQLKEGIQTEEATKTSLIMPFFAALGFDVFNPNEFIPEFVADVGIKKGEKVDYAIVIHGEPAILIEVKWCGEQLDRHSSQLFRYFGTTKAKFAILTNGIQYRFYTDLESPNRMDEKPFWIFDLQNPRDNQIAQLKKFCKDEFDVDAILTTASELKYSSEFKRILARELQNPSDEFVKFFLSETFDGKKNQNVIDKFRLILKQALNNYISELMNDKIQSALISEEKRDQKADSNSSSERLPLKRKKGITTTNEELEAYFIIKHLLKDVTKMENITYRDTASYINILYQDNGWKWICRLVLNSTSKTLLIPDENKNAKKYTLESIYDLENYKDQLIEVLKRYM